MAYTDKMAILRWVQKHWLCWTNILASKYPNPFNPSTTINTIQDLLMGQINAVNITVYDILGRNIKTLINEQQSIGRYRVKWNVSKRCPSFIWHLFC